jgi:hypothetical protein
MVAHAPLPPAAEDSGRAGTDAQPRSTRVAPLPTPTPIPVVWTDLTVQAVTDLAGGEPTCPGCDGVTPADAQAASTRPVGTVRVRVWAIQDGERTDLGPTELLPVSAGVATATLRVPESDSYVVAFESADGDFVPCPAAAPEVRVSPAEGGMFAAFRMWAGCPVSPPAAERPVYLR